MVPPDSTDDVPATQWLDGSNFHKLVDLLQSDIAAVATSCKLIGSDGRAERKGRLSDAFLILWALLLWAVLGKSLASTSTLLQNLSSVTISPGALRQRFLQAEKFLSTLLNSSIVSLRDFDKTRWAGYRIFLVDATVVTRPGSKGTDARIHHTLQLPSLCPQEIILSDPTRGESFCNLTIDPTRLYLGDRAYSSARGIAHVIDGRAEVLVRYNPFNLSLSNSPRLIRKPSNKSSYRKNAKNPKARRQRRINANLLIPDPKDVIDVQSLCKKLILPGQQLDQTVWIHRKDHLPIKGRLIIVKIPKENVAEQLLRIKREQGKPASTNQAFYAQYIMLFTTVPFKALSTELVVELYRLRWQIEREFKREKSIQGMDEMPNITQDSIGVWLLAHMLAQQLLRRQLLAATANLDDPIPNAEAISIHSLPRAPWSLIKEGWQILKTTILYIPMQFIPAFLLKFSQTIQQRTLHKKRVRAIESFIKHLYFKNC